MKAFVLALMLWVSLQADATLEQADAAFRAGDFPKAAALARRVLAQDSTAVHAHLILGVIAAQSSDWAASNRHFAQVVRFQPTNPHGYFYLGQAKLYQKQWQAAIEYFSKALELRYPDEQRLLIELALAQNEAGRPKQALATLAKTKTPSEQRQAAQYHAVLAFAHAKLNEPRDAIEAMRRALALDDAHPDHWDFLIRTLMQDDEPAQALAEAIRAQKKFPDQADIQFLFALTSYYVTESPLSALALRNLREAEPDSPRVLLAEGLLYRKQDKTAEATNAFQRAAQRGVPDAHLLLGIVYRESGDYEAAEREYREAERINPRNGQVMLELGKMLLTSGQLEQARIRLEQAAQYMPDSTSVHYQLGLLYRRLGQPEKSRHHFELSKRP
jgi:tetratricopeptide (TPR) repeat protein